MWHSEDFGDDEGQQKLQPFHEETEVVAGGGEDGIYGGAGAAGEIISTQSMLGLEMADHVLNRGLAAQDFLDGVNHTALLARGEDFQSMFVSGVVTFVAGVCNDLGQADADLALDLGQDLSKV